MDVKLAGAVREGDKKGLFRAEIWGKRHKELRVDTQFVRF